MTFLVRFWKTLKSVSSARMINRSLGRTFIEHFLLKTSKIKIKNVPVFMSRSQGKRVSCNRWHLISQSRSLGPQTTCLCFLCNHPSQSTSLHFPDYLRLLFSPYTYPLTHCPWKRSAPLVLPVTLHFPLGKSSESPSEVIRYFIIKCSLSFLWFLCHCHPLAFCLDFYISHSVTSLLY